ncbi:galactokinase [Abditibacterium utsteinense]|uniref:Galactokinase n=1 Tax=Abditibacterium utsteinense TaxID=1960156 RepID=A0A2S8SUA2_9BACT|nr:galactokinase [Abditibacterium utsteinense]PQV64371.1 galactokinase [Abditibacterium utsteinense]
MTTQDHFQARFGAAASFFVRSPGRVNLIGEHVDYNDGFVLPMAVPLQTEMALRPRNDGKVVLYSPLFDDEREFSLDAITKQNAWIDYAQGVAVELQKDGFALQGFEGVVTSNIPLASGLSSSASIEVAVALAFLHLAGVQKSPVEVALLCQRAENIFIGVNSGIMDQMAVAACTKDHVLLLDCRSLEMEQVPLQLENHVIVVTDSAAPRELASSAYNERRAECEEGLAILQKMELPARSLRDITPLQLSAHSSQLPEVVLKRVRHVVEEIARTGLAVAELKRGDLEAFGERMNESHDSLRHFYEVSSAELDFLTDFARSYDGVLGSRMTGAGFGGCTVTLIEKDKAEAFIAAQIAAYKTATNRDARGWICDAAAGAEILLP